MDFSDSKQADTEVQMKVCQLNIIKQNESLIDTLTEEINPVVTEKLENENQEKLIQRHFMEFLDHQEANTSCFDILIAF